MFVPIAYLQFVFGMRFRVSGDQIEIHQPALIIMNHRTRLDWMYFWSALFKINPWLITTSKITLKSQLKRLPGAGFGMAANQFIFLERNIQVDTERFSEAVNYYVDMQRPYQLLLFPEGTDKSPWTSAKSEEYARKNGLHPLKHVIYPRSAGFTHLLNKMRSVDYITCIYDVTVAYPNGIVQSEIDLVLKGKAPTEVHFHVNRIDICTVPQGDDQINTWLNRLWLDKDAKLTRFYSETDKRKMTLVSGKDDCIWEEDDRMTKAVRIMIALFWLGVVTIWTYHLFVLRLVQIGFVYFLLISAWINWRYGGIDRMVLSKWQEEKLLDVEEKKKEKRGCASI